MLKILWCTTTTKRLKHLVAFKRCAVLINRRLSKLETYQEPRRKVIARQVTCFFLTPTPVRCPISRQFLALHILMLSMVGNLNVITNRTLGLHWIFRSKCELSWMLWWMIVVLKQKSGEAPFGSPSETHFLSGVNFSEKIRENQKKRLSLQFF